MAKRKRPKAKEATAEVDASVAETNESSASVDAAVAEGQEATASMDASVADDRSEDATRPDMDVAANLAASDQFEAKKKGEANEPPSSGVWGQVAERITAVVADAEVTAGHVKVFGPTVDSAKQKAAQVWRVLGELNREKILSDLPTVAFEVRE